MKIAYTGPSLSASLGSEDLTQYESQAHAGGPRRTTQAWLEGPLRGILKGTCGFSAMYPTMDFTIQENLVSVGRVGVREWIPSQILRVYSILKIILENPWLFKTYKRHTGTETD